MVLESLLSLEQAISPKSHNLEPHLPHNKSPKGFRLSRLSCICIHIIIIFCLAFCHSNSHIIGVCNSPLPRLDHKDQVLLFIMLKIIPHGFVF